MTLTDQEFRLFRNLIYEESGILIKETRKEFLEKRVLKRISETGASSPYWYYRYIASMKTDELLVLLDLMTINETSFFRNRPQIDFFNNSILPELIKKKETGGSKTLRIWSAGCSTGEEPYSIAMGICETIAYSPNWNIKIFASDISLASLKIAKDGEYSEDKVRATVDDHLIDKYFENNGNFFRIKDEIKKLVVFDFNNLKNDNGLRNLDVIFCRNVIIYFPEDNQIKLINRFYENLSPGGYLLLGHSESIQGWNTGFNFIHNNKGTAYKKPEETKTNEDNLKGVNR
ncbi:MAG TPA: protein-glutamate O-methyltransferase CheR [bacterium]